MLPKKIKDFYQRYTQSNIQTNSAAMAFHTVLTIVPILGLIFLYLKEIGISNHWFTLTRNFLLFEMNISPDSVMIQYFDQLTSPVKVSALGWVGITVIFYTAWNLMGKFGEGLDRVLDTSPEKHHMEKRSLWNLWTRRLLGMLILPIGISFSVVAVHWIRKDSWLHYLIGSKAAKPWVAFSLAWAVDILIFFLIYYFVPRTRIRKKQAFKASILVGFLMEITRLIFGHLVRYSVFMSRIYGILVVIPLFILWVQIAWMIFLSGALFIRFQPEKR